MGFLDKIFGFIGNEGSKIINTISDTVDKFVMTKEEKEKLKQELLKLEEQRLQNERQFRVEIEKLTQEREAEIEKTIRAELDTTKEILVAELNQGDNYTKRARPTVIYAGLVFILLELFGIRQFIINQIDPTLIASSNEIFKIFLLAWSGVVGVYTIGRSAEKRGLRTAWTSSITGSADTQSLVSEGHVKRISNRISGLLR